MTVNETVGTHEVKVTLDPAPATNISLDYTVSGTATAGTDYSALPGSVAVASGVSSVVIPVVITDDNVQEGDETIMKRFLLCGEGSFPQLMGHEARLG